MSEEKIRMTFVQKLENYWYHYKWHTLFGIFMVIIFGVCITQCASKTEPDAMVLYAGRLKNMITPSEDYREPSFESILDEDYNGDGEKIAEVFQLIIPIAEIGGEYELDDKAAQTNNSEYQRFYTEIATGNCVIYMLHPLLYEDVKEKGILRPLSEVLDEVPDYAVDEYGIPISELIAYRRTALRYYPEDCIICIRHERKKGSGAITYDDPEMYENCVKFFNDVIEY